MKEQEKFQTLIDALGITVYQFGKDLGFARVEPIYKILRGDTKDPGASIYGKIKKAYPKVNTDWLLTGEGSIFIKNENQIENEWQEKVTELESENRVLSNLYEKQTAKLAQMGKSKGVNLSPDVRNPDLRKRQFDDTKKSLRGKRGVSKTASVHVQGVKIPSLLDLLQ